MALWEAVVRLQQLPFGNASQVIIVNLLCLIILFRRRPSLASCVGIYRRKDNPVQVIRSITILSAADTNCDHLIHYPPLLLQTASHLLHQSLAERHFGAGTVQSHLFQASGSGGTGCRQRERKPFTRKKDRKKKIKKRQGR